MKHLQKYHIITFGCQMNVHESEKLSATLGGLGLEKTDQKADADIIVFNTCTVRENAVKRLMGNVGALKNLKKKRPELIIAILGCATQNKSDAEQIYKKYPYVDIILGTHNIGELSKLIEVRKPKERVFSVVDSADACAAEPLFKRENPFAASVNIMYGCNNFCSYCIVPYVRGRERSRPHEDIVNECKALVDSGVREITLLGQNANSYGAGTDVSFTRLLNMISSIEGRFRIKFMTSHPKDISDDLIDAVRCNDKISKHVHLPVQSGSTSVLAAMNRGYSREDYLRIVQKLKTIPNVNITSDIIVGFPSESEKDFLETESLVKEVGFSAIYAFAFSPRSGTKAFEMPDSVSAEEKSRRLTSLLSVQKQITAELAATKLGEQRELLCIKDGGKMVALSISDEVVCLDEYREGEFVNAEIVKVVGGRLYGRINEGK